MRNYAWLPTMVLLISVGCAPQEKDLTRIGVILPLTGNAAVYGKSLKNGIDLALEQEPEASARLKVLFEDDQGAAVQALSAARKLIDVDQVPVIIGGAMSSTAEPILPLMKEKNVVLLSPTATKASLTKTGSPFFRLWPSDDYDGEVMADAAVNKLGVKRVAVMYVNVAYGQGIAAVFKREFERRGGQIVAMEGYSEGSTDFRSQLAKLKALNPEAVYLPGYVAEISNILRQSLEMGFKTRFLGATGLKDDSLIKIAGKGAEGAVLTYPTYDPESSDPEVKAFVLAYKNRFAESPDAFAAQGYDAMRILESIVSTGARDAKSIKDALVEMELYKGPGGAVDFNEDGEVKKPLRLLMVKGGVFVPFDA